MRNKRYAATVTALVLLMVVPPSAQAARPSGLGLKQVAARRGVNMGAQISVAPLNNDPLYTQTLAAEYNMVVAGNEMKWENIHPQPNGYDFTDADALVNFAAQHGMKVRGHTLLWHAQFPSWLASHTGPPTNTATSFTRAQLIDILRDHIHTVVGRYKGRIVEWDVVNEVMGDPTGSPPTSTLRSSFWLNMIGPEFIDLAFQFAREADPAAVLYLNDYGAELMGVKSDAIYQLASELISRGVPIDGVGMQMHFSINGIPSRTSVEANMARLNALGLKTIVTEMDVRIPILTQEVPVGNRTIRVQGSASAAQKKQQAVIYRDMLGACLASDCPSFVTWGFTDKYSWIPGFAPGYGAALPFDEHYQPKPAYWGMRRALGETGEVRVVEAESMPRKTTGAAISNGWNLYTNGEISTPLEFSGDDTYLFTVIAKGTKVGGLGPLMRLKIDGFEVGRVAVTSSEWKPYEFITAGYAGTHTVAIEFLNDAYVPPEDRNLMIDKVAISSLHEATRMFEQTTGSAVADGWRLDQSGYIADMVDFPESVGDYVFRITARGASTDAVAPLLQLEIDGVPVAWVQVGMNSAMQSHYKRLQVPAGPHRISVSLLNPSSSGGRQLIVGDVGVGAVPTLS